MRLEDHSPVTDQTIPIERSAMVRLMASGRLGERLAATARAAAAIHLAELARTGAAPSPARERPA